MHFFSQLFGEGPILSVGQECARAVLIFVYGVALLRLAGRRIFGKWAALDVILSIVVGSCLGRTLTGDAPLGGTLAAMAVLVALHRAAATLAARWTAISRLLEGQAIDLGPDGASAQRNRRQHAVSQADFNEALRGSGIDDMDKARRILLEPSGEITVLKH